MSAKLVEANERSHWNKVVPFCQSESTALSAQALTKVQDQIVALTTAMSRRDQEYLRFATGLQSQIDGLQQDKETLSGRLHELEGELAGSKASQRTMQASLQQRESENAQLTKAVSEHATQNSQILAKLAVYKREHKNMRTTLTRQEKLLAEAARKESNQALLCEKMEEKRSLEVELQTAQDKISAKQGAIVAPTALASGGILALFTGGLGGLFGLVGGALVSGKATESAACPCMTQLFADLESVKRRLSLVNQEIGRLESL